MPEFILNLGSPLAAARYNGLDEFTQGYIEAMFFTDTGYSENDDLHHATFAELAPVTLEKIITDCQQFQTANAADIDEAIDTGRIKGYNMKAAGRDYWYTRNGHGCGYWDRGLGAIGDKLAKIARYSEVALYRGDDGMIYLG